jgi:VWFA-related protein
LAKAQARPKAGDATKSAAARPEAAAQDDVVKVTTSLVRVPVAVRDGAGRYVGDLRQEDFRLFEDGREQRIAHFNGIEEPISVVLLIDASCSIRKPEETISGALTFIDQLRPGDSALPIAFGKNIYTLLTESTRDHALLRARLRELPDNKRIPCDGGTRLGDAVEFVINHVLKNGTGRKAVVMLTDGRDSLLSKPGWGPRTLHSVSELGVPFYSIHLASYNRPLFRGWPGEPEAEKSKTLFSSIDLEQYIDELSDLSGGRGFPVAANGEEFRSDFEQIGNELRHQYMLAYYPDKHGDKQERRKIKVRVNRGKLSVRARGSYLYIPPEK